MPNCAPPFLSFSSSLTPDISNPRSQRCASAQLSPVLEGNTNKKITDATRQTTHGFYPFHQYVQDKRYIGTTGRYYQYKRCLDSGLLSPIGASIKLQYTVVLLCTVPSRVYLFTPQKEYHHHRLNISLRAKTMGNSTTAPHETRDTGTISCRGTKIHKLISVRKEQT